jgi:hypothetical protein
MKKIFILLSVLVWVMFAAWQVPTRWNKNPSPFQFVWVLNDSVNRMPLDTLHDAPDGSLARKNHALWMKDTTWKKIAWLTDVTGGGGGGGAWGSITGTLADQGDLQTALNAKLNKTDTSTMLAHYIVGLGNLSPLFTTSKLGQFGLFTLSSQSANKVFGTTIAGLPGFIGPLDSNQVGGLHTQGYYDARYVQNVSGSGGTLNFTDGIQQLGNNVVALHDLGLWNARRFQGFDIQPGSPSDGDFYVFHSSCNCYELVNITDVGGGGGGGGGGTSSVGVINIDTTYRRLASVLNDTSGVIKSIKVLVDGVESTPTEETDTTLVYNITTHYVPAASFYADVSNSGSAETDLYSYTVPANSLVTNGDKLLFKFGGEFNSPTAAVLTFYFASATVPIPSSSANQEWEIIGSVIRSGSGTARLTLKVTGSFSGVMYLINFDIPSIDWTTTNILKITGQDASSSQITAKSGFIDKVIQ